MTKEKQNWINLSNIQNIYEQYSLTIKQMQEEIQNVEKKAQRAMRVTLWLKIIKLIKQKIPWEFLPTGLIILRLY